MRRLTGRRGLVAVLAGVALLLAGCASDPVDAAALAASEGATSGLQVAPTPLCPGPDCPMGPDFTPPPGGGTPMPEGWVGPCAEGGSLYGTPYCEGVRDGTTVGPCDVGGAYVNDPTVCPFGPAGGAATPTATPTSTATPTPTPTATITPSPTPTTAPSGSLGPCEPGGVLAGTDYCVRVRAGLEVGPCAVGGAYVNDPTVCPVGPATGSPSPTATPAPSPTPAPTAVATAPPAPAVTPTATPAAVLAVGILPPPDLSFQCPGSACPWGPEWTPPCAAGGPLEGTPECVAALAGNPVGPCAPGGSAYGDAVICPWTAGVIAELAASGGFFGSAPGDPDGAAVGAVFGGDGGGDALAGLLFTPAVPGGSVGGFAGLAPSARLASVYAGAAGPMPPAGSDAFGGVSPFAAPPPPPEGMFGVPLAPVPDPSTIVPSGQVIAGGDDAEVVPRVIERFAGLFRAFRLRSP